MELKLVEIWRHVLGVSRVGITDNFYELGGHSLKATQLMSRIRKELDIEIPLREIFRNPTIMALSDSFQHFRTHRYSSIKNAPSSNHYPLSVQQKRMFILHKFEQESTRYNETICAQIKGSLNIDRVKEVIGTLISRHEILRSSIGIVNDEPVQTIHSDLEFEIWHKTLSDMKQLKQTIHEFIQPFDLTRAPLFRMGLVQVAENEYILICDAHHIITDGVSMNVLLEEFIELYEGGLLPPLPIQYKDYAVWQQDFMQSENIKKQEKYWLETYTGELPILEIPADYSRLVLQQAEGDQVSISIDKELSFQLNQKALESGTTLYMLLLAGYSVLLSKYTGQEDIIIGSPIAGRQQAEVDRVLGIFLNTLAMRTRPESNKKFSAFLREVKEFALQAYENQDYPFMELVEKLNLQRHLNRNPLFDTMFMMQNRNAIERKVQNISIQPFDFTHPSCKFDISLTAVETNKELEFKFEYDIALFRRETVERLAKHWVHLLREISSDNDKNLNEIEMLDDNEKSQLLHSFNDTTIVNGVVETSIVHLFEEQVKRTPNHVAVQFESSSLTYAELNALSNQLARGLKRKGVGSNRVVGVMVKRSVELFVAIFGILKAGGAYLPIDPEYPLDRIEYMLSDSCSGLLITQKQLIDMQDGFMGEIVFLEDGGVYDEDQSNLENRSNPEDLIYVIYTSGSTGKPKGVMIEHMAVHNFIHGMLDRIPFLSFNTVITLTTISFDIFVLETLLPLTQGLKVVIAGEHQQNDPEKLLNLIANHNVDILQSTPSRLQLLLNHNNADACLSHLKVVLVGGEAFSETLRERLLSFPKLLIFNMYGPTETTVWSTVAEINSSSSITIGKPINNTQIYILNSEQLLQPIGIKGELCISGLGLSRGYLNRPELTAERFVAHPFNHGERIYKTGDLARWLPDGNIEFLGRVDDQVKIRGYRIELGEVESALIAHDAIEEVSVIAREDAEGKKILCAYFIADEQLSAKILRSYLTRILPVYMIPSFFVQMERMPLTSNGKLDRKALPLLPGNIKTEVAYEAPRNKLEEILVNIWKEVLGVQRVGIWDNFFELGGDSISAIRISTRMQNYQIKMEVKDLFHHLCIGELSSYIYQNPIMINQEVVQGHVGLTPNQRRFFEYQLIEKHPTTQSIILFRSEGIDEVAVREVLGQIVTHHDVLRTIFSNTSGEFDSWIRGLEGELFQLKVYEESQGERIHEVIKARIDEIEESLDLSEGPLLKGGLFKTGQGDYLLLVVSRLVIDGESWRILLEDLNMSYDQILNNEKIQLPAKTDSYRSWARLLQDYTNSEQILNDILYWQNNGQIELKQLPKDYENEGSSYIDIGYESFDLTDQETEELLKNTHYAFNTDPNDILLAALGTAIYEWNDSNHVVIELDGYGRSSFKDQIDLRRTMGWFTNRFPIILETDPSKGLSYVIKSVKEQLRHIPNEGIGYGALRYSHTPSLATPLTDTIRPEIGYQRLVHFDQENQTEHFTTSSFDIGLSTNENIEGKVIIHMHGVVLDGRLRMTATYNRNVFSKVTISNFTVRYMHHIQSMIEHCLSVENKEKTPSDLSFNSISLDEMEDLKKSIVSLLKK
ncbi:non-ribosomal peptide synthetase [Cohnella faecalis]|uniref:Amino acid adenylation domain-containing protein n=1 Tax=Cohnella faecalis TaxID=2315694 RepID=A0A398CR01_9BACL|nr:non-ribosomal peptide synthetase [Cohnella faecalis]RIE04963.1 amino acid adenylation domain-containing protein [Cohnella faecalis]